MNTKPDSKLRAWKVYADDVEAACIVFETTRNKARALGMRADWFGMEGVEWTEIKAVRQPEVDHWAGDGPELLDGSGLKSAQVMHALGWQCIDSPSCDHCGTGEWEGVPESVVVEREDCDGEALCEGCYKAERADRTNGTDLTDRVTNPEQGTQNQEQ